jgi:NTP pyrophosphatase (non-canonical NTP hydrolase)
MTTETDVSGGMRGEVVEFALAMERELRANDHKRGWAGLTLKQLLNRLREETSELQKALGDGKGVDEVQAEAADVANFALMIADNYRRLKSEEMLRRRLETETALLRKKARVSAK